MTPYGVCIESVWQLLHAIPKHHFGKIQTMVIYSFKNNRSSSFLDHYEKRSIMGQMTECLFSKAIFDVHSEVCSAFVSWVVQFPCSVPEISQKFVEKKICY